jgi:hypothetical protein
MALADGPEGNVMLWLGITHLICLAYILELVNGAPLLDEIDA